MPSTLYMLGISSHLLVSKQCQNTRLCMSLCKIYIMPWQEGKPGNAEQSMLHMYSLLWIIVVKPAVALSLHEAPPQLHAVILPIDFHACRYGKPIVLQSGHQRLARRSRLRMSPADAWPSCLNFRVSWPGWSFAEVMRLGTNIRLPPCSSPPLAGAQVGL